PIAGFSDDAPLSGRASCESTLEWTSRKSATFTQPIVHSESRFADCTVADHEHAERTEPIRDAGRSGQYLVHRRRLGNRMGSRGPSIRHARGYGTGYSTT